MTFRVVVEVPSSLLRYNRTEKAAAHLIANILEEADKANLVKLYAGPSLIGFNWHSKVKSYSRVRGAERRSLSPSKDILTLQGVIQDLTHVIQSLKEQEDNG